MAPKTQSGIIFDSQYFHSLVEKEGFLGEIENKIILDDCLQALQHIPSDCIDLIHTSPPYNIDKQYAESISDSNDLTHYEDFLRQIISETKRILRPGGSIFWQTGYTQSNSGQEGDILPIDIATYQYFRERPNRMTLWDRIIWRYWGGHAFKKKLTNKHETILWYVKPGLEPNFSVDAIREKAKEYDKRNNFWGRNPGNVWEVDRVAYGSTEQTSHIAVFPEEISEKIIRSCSKPGDIVLDPFCGSGTVPKVARSLARRWIGIEISPVYAGEAAARIGYQQPSEADSLTSELIKGIAFLNKPGTLDISTIARTLNVWRNGVDIDTLKEHFDHDVSKALSDTRASGNQKKSTWVKYDNLANSPSSQEPVLVADRMLMRCYKNRHNLNGVSRYRSALDLLQDAVAMLNKTDPDVQKHIKKIAKQEPSSFQIDGSLVNLMSVNRKVGGETSSLTLGESTEDQTRLF